jgi:type I restriction enzyme M protein
LLDSETKRRIDSARDILVGKVPDPKSQVEQITIALIYKFMDDMDKQSVELGGKASFFKGEFKKYGWSDIFDPRLGGVEMLNLYGEAITRMSQNANLPELFRNIFKNAYLPYRDPETLKLFLKTINDFTYDHSEKLGDAFEYLLSVLGSQGDAGQFRTPRHIIDFMVQVVDPKKNETVLDPACGTAGFLISAYKHIVKSSQDSGKPLNAQDKQRLYENFTGYDISHRYGAALARQPVFARLRQTADPRIRLARQRRTLERVRRCDPCQPSVYVAKGRHYAAQKVFGAVEPQ